MDQQEGSVLPKRKEDWVLLLLTCSVKETNARAGWEWSTCFLGALAHGMNLSLSVSLKWHRSPVGTRQCEREQLGLVAVLKPAVWRRSQQEQAEIFFRFSWQLIQCERERLGLVAVNLQCEGDHCASRLRMEPLVRRAKSCPCLTCSLIIHPPTPAHR